MKLTVEIGFLLGLAILVIDARAEESENVFQRTFTFNRWHQEHSPPSSPPGTHNPTNVQTLYIEQKLDHFDEAEQRTWQMRYMSNDEFYVEGGPFFIFVGGEWSISPFDLSKDHMYDMAEEHNGYLFYTEHRYYGQSRPTSDLSNENMKYLHVRQALADLAHFIRTMKATLPGAKNSKVILVGCSYAATMVTWFKKEYPDFAAGCWASSAPLLAKVDITEFKEVTGKSITLVGGADCYNRIQNGIAELELMLANKRGAEVKAMLNLCSNFDENNGLDVWKLFSEISEKFGDLVQGHTHSNISSACNKIMEGDDDASGVIGYLAAEFPNSSCHDLSYKGWIDLLTNETYGNDLMRPWTYQTCNEYGWYRTSGSKQQPFGTKFPIQLFTTMCRDAYGDEFTTEAIYQKVAETNAHFGGLNPGVENVYFTHGQLDPWRTLGIQAEGQATVIPMAVHCDDFGSINANDTPEMRASKEKVAKLVREWLRDD